MNNHFAIFDQQLASANPPFEKTFTHFLNNPPVLDTFSFEPVTQSEKQNRYICCQVIPLFTLGSIYSTYASGAV